YPSFLLQRSNGFLETLGRDGNRKVTLPHHDARRRRSVCLGLRLLPLRLRYCQGLVRLPLVLRVGRRLSLSFIFGLAQGGHLRLSFVLGFFFGRLACRIVNQLLLSARTSLPARCNVGPQLHQVCFRPLSVFPRFGQSGLRLAHGLALGLCPCPGFFLEALLLCHRRISATSLGKEMFQILRLEFLQVGNGGRGERAEGAVAND